MTFKRIHLFLLAVPLATGCMRPSTGTSHELINARAAYARAQQSGAATDAPRSLEEARHALAEAERAHQLDPSSHRERHLAYLAKRRAEIAIEKANTLAAERQAALAKEQLSRNAAEAGRAAEQARAEAEANAQRLQVANDQLTAEADARASAERTANASQGELARLEQELADTRRRLSERGSQLDDQTRQLKDREVALQSQIDLLRIDRDRAEQLRAQAEEAKSKAQKERDQALATIRSFATVDENDDRGLVITVPAEVVFRTGSAKLLPRAKDKLDELALALNNLGPTDQAFVIEGHTDSRGSAAYNQRLSKRRASAVRSYLIEQGVDGDRIVARGKGEADPVASNRDAEGRANNRRVEIVVTPATVSER